MSAADPTKLNLASTLFDALPLFHCLTSSSKVLSSTTQLFPTKIKFLHKPLPVQSLHSGIHFVIPEGLLVNEQALLEKAIMKVLSSDTKGVVLDVPDWLARKFNKTPVGYPILNELVYRSGELTFPYDIRCLVVTDTRPTSIMEPEYGFVCSVDYVCALCQGLLVTARHQNTPNRVEYIKNDIRTIRAAIPTLKTKPAVAIRGDTIITQVCDDVEFNADDLDFLGQVCELLYHFYLPYTKIEDAMKW